ncbi:basic proline-rich protein-like [Schistocerca serialis cubense]|uniref:basic proline-rich protein-like n=1 Tax=Schistocerca serialis cubense TaxID=2023355 RepID=UPI00214E270F|nr:basic proline-rich protein-like [Schistocerca serialis cubense]
MMRRASAVLGCARIGPHLPRLQLSRSHPPPRRPTGQPASGDRGVAPRPCSARDSRRAAPQVACGGAWPGSAATPPPPPRPPPLLNKSIAAPAAAAPPCQSGATPATPGSLPPPLPPCSTSLRNRPASPACGVLT